MLRQVPYSFRFTFSHRYIAHYGAVLGAIDPLPFRETGFERKCFTIFSASRKLHDLAARCVERSERHFKSGKPNAIARGADPVDRLADHFGRLVAENRHGPRVPNRDQPIPVGANQTITKRHSDALKTPVRNTHQQAAEIDLIDG
jgi:hypothetical protein